MRATELITVDRIACPGSAPDKQSALELPSALIAPAQGDPGPGEVPDSLLGQEQLGSTGFGQGVALPHGRVGAGEPIAAFAGLLAAVEFEAVDRQPLDLPFTTLVPEQAIDDYLPWPGQQAGRLGQGDFPQAPDAHAVQRISHCWQPQTH